MLASGLANLIMKQDPARCVTAVSFLWFVAAMVILLESEACLRSREFATGPVWSRNPKVGILEAVSAFELYVYIRS